MLDVVIVILLGRAVGRVAMSKGLPRGWGALALVPLLGEVAAIFWGASTGALGTTLYVWGFGGLVATASVVWVVVQSLPPAAGWRPGMRWAGWCRKCKANVWLTEDMRRCEYGHPAGNVRKLHVPPQQGGKDAMPSPV